MRLRMMLGRNTYCVDRTGMEPLEPLALLWCIPELVNCLSKTSWSPAVCRENSLSKPFSATYWPSTIPSEQVFVRVNYTPINKNTPARKVLETIGFDGDRGMILIAEQGLGK